MRLTATLRTHAPLALALAALALLLPACDGLLDRTPKTEQTGLDSSATLRAGEALPEFRFGYEDERPPEGGALFAAAVSVKGADGRWDRRKGWIWFPPSVMAEAGGRTRPLRLRLESQEPGGTRLFVAEVPDLAGVGAAVGAWFRGDGDAFGAQLQAWRWDCEAVTYTEVDLDYWLLGCDQNRAGLECSATRCTAVWEQEEWEGPPGGGGGGGEPRPPWEEECTDPTAYCGPGGPPPPWDECNPYFDSTCEDPQDWLMNRTEKEKVERKYVSCPAGTSRGDIFSRDVREALGLEYRPGQSGEERDGLQRVWINGREVVNVIMESKLSPYPPAQGEYAQFRRFLDELHSLYSALGPNQGTINAPSIIVVSTAEGDIHDLTGNDSFNRQLYDEAHRLGINIFHYVVAQRFGFGDYRLYGGLVSRRIVGSYNYGSGSVILRSPWWVDQAASNWDNHAIGAPLNFSDCRTDK